MLDHIELNVISALCLSSHVMAYSMTYTLTNLVGNLEGILSFKMKQC